MDTLPLLDRVDPAVLIGVALLSAVALVFTVVRCGRSLRFLMGLYKDQEIRLQGLRTHKMLARLGVSGSRYLSQADMVDVERHLWNCRNCTTIDTCDAFLAHRTTTPPSTFCPNHHELKVFVPSAKLAEPSL